MFELTKVLFLQMMNMKNPERIASNNKKVNFFIGSAVE
jgi:hypothetical protein